MSLGTVKILIAIVAAGVGIAAFVSQMLRMGVVNNPRDPEKLRRFHRLAGYTFVILLAPLVVLGAKFWAGHADALSMRAGFHIVFALSLLMMLLLKVLIARKYRGFIRMSPPLGLTLFSLLWLVFALSAVFAGLMRVLG